jgi:hypothetical protein
MANKFDCLWQLLQRVALSGFLFQASGAIAQQSAGDNASPNVYRFGDTTLKFSGELTVVYFDSNQTYWGIAGIFFPGTKTDFRWTEGALKSGVRLDRRLGDNVTFYAGLSAIASFTLNEDPYLTKDVGTAAFEDAYAGFAFGRPGEGWYGDLSAGAQRYVVGTGLLLGDGAPEGSARGAVNFAPYQAWEKTAIARIGYGPVQLDMFYLSPDVIFDPPFNTEVIGTDLKYTIRPNEYVGMYGGQVIDSDAPYLRALPDLGGSVIVPGGRDGLKFVNAYFRWNPLAETEPGFWISGDIVQEWNSRIDMKADGWRIAFGNKFADLPLSPTISYNFYTLSGDDPNTPTLEKFDPIAGGLSEGNWTVGANSAMIFGNSNINIHRFLVAATLSNRDKLTFKYFVLSTNELNSSLIVGSPPSGGGIGPFPPIVSSGSKRLADEIAIDYTRIISENATVTLSVNYSKPGGALVDFAGQPVDDWLNIAAGVVIKF